MVATKTAGAFLQRHGKDYYEAGQFNVYRVGDFCQDISLPANRRDFYKISLVVKCEGVFTYADKTLHVKDNAISFSNPMIPYAWQRLSEAPTGYFCMFTEEFVNHHLKTESLAESPLFRVGGNPVLFLNQTSMALLTGIFEQMLTEINSSYPNKYDLLRSYVQIIMHEALKIEPPEMHYSRGAPSARISDLFLELLERQFPVTSPQHTIRFKNANEFAGQLSVHTNHLNRALKDTTGKTTTEHISERLTKEAKALLLHSNWNVAEIGYCLGFEHASNFNIFFKKQTAQAPSQFRKQLVSIS